MHPHMKLDIILDCHKCAYSLVSNPLAHPALPSSYNSLTESSH